LDRCVCELDVLQVKVQQEAMPDDIVQTGFRVPSRRGDSKP
jgi:hypothetical protein